MLTDDERKAYQAVVLKTAERTPFAVDRTGGGLDVLSQLLLGIQGTTSVLPQIDARNSDGGWGWEAGVPSVSLTTGLALYVLAKVQVGDDVTVLKDARKWLLTSQQPDGSWLTPSKNITKSTDPERLKSRDEIYHYWGTAWVAIGLLEPLGKSGI